LGGLRNAEFLAGGSTALKDSAGNSRVEATVKHALNLKRNVPICQEEYSMKSDELDSAETLVTPLVDLCRWRWRLAGLRRAVRL